MKLGIITTAALSFLLGIAAPLYAQQDQSDQKQEQKDKPAEKKAPEDKSARQNGKTTQQQDRNTKPEERNAQPQDKSARQQDKNNNQQETNAQRQDKNTKQEEQNPEQTQRSAGNHGGRIPDDRFRANFGREHSFRVSQDDYSRDRRFQYGGYWFGFVDAWPRNWLYTEDVFVVEIDGVYYLCNPMYPGVNVTLSIAD
jgi:hypothetical protein